MLRSLIRRSPLALMAIALAVPALYGTLATDPVPASQEKQGCGRTEWVVHQAGQCLLYPVQRWERLGDIAGVRFPSRAFDARLPPRIISRSPPFTGRVR